MDAPLTPNAVRVLRTIRESAMDGYTVQSKSGVRDGDLIVAVRELQDRGLVMAKGDIAPDRVGEAYLYVPPDATGYADLLLGRFRYSVRSSA